MNVIKRVASANTNKAFYGSGINATQTSTFYQDPLTLLRLLSYSIYAIIGP